MTPMAERRRHTPLYHATYNRCRSYTKTRKQAHPVHPRHACIKGILVTNETTWRFRTFRLVVYHRRVEYAEWKYTKGRASDHPGPYRRPMTLCHQASLARHQPADPLQETHHLKRPDTSDPDLQLAFHTLDVLQLDALPPASPGWLAPEKEQLLRHADGVAIGRLAADVCP